MSQAAYVSTTFTAAGNGLSFLLGMVAAVPELRPLRMFFHRARPMVAALDGLAPAKGRWLDGYDLVSDFAARRVYRRGGAA